MGMSIRIARFSPDIQPAPLQNDDRMLFPLKKSVPVTILASSDCARRGVSGALFPKSALAGLNSRMRVLLENEQAVLIGRRATDNHEPRQVRKEAAISEPVCVADRSRLCNGSCFPERFNCGCTIRPRFTAPSKVNFDALLLPHRKSIASLNLF